jgi:hypothetical protein
MMDMYADKKSFGVAKGSSFHSSPNFTTSKKAAKQRQLIL